MNEIIDFLTEFNAVTVVIRVILAAVAGALVGLEREFHGRAAGMRTHILVCLGAALTSMISLYVRDCLGDNHDILRISAQVVSGIGFLGAGMIILKENHMIMGLTTAAGVWTTSIIGIAVGFGFYTGAIIAALLALFVMMFFSKLEKGKRTFETIYIEIDDMYKTNEILNILSERFKDITAQRIVPPKRVETAITRVIPRPAKR